MGTNEHSMVSAPTPDTKRPAGHTPGPWNFDPFASDGREVGYIRTRFGTEPPFSGRGEAVARVVGRREWGPATFDANARLIAAAPLLLEACETLKRIVCNNFCNPSGREWHHKQCIEASAVVAKARGGAA